MQSSKAQVTYAPHSHHPTHDLLAQFQIPPCEDTKPQHMFPFPLTLHWFQHRVETTAPQKPPFIPDLPRIQRNFQPYEMDKRFEHPENARTSSMGWLGMGLFMINRE
jgi:hypothetical protein